MYVIRRIYTVKPGEARRAATLVSALGEAYEEAGTRSPSRVYFNSGTTPGEKNTVVMEWTDDALQSPYRADRVRVDGLEELRAQLNEVSLGSQIEFWELMTPDKRV